MPITARMLSDILSRLVETIAEQGDDMQGNLQLFTYVIADYLIWVMRFFSQQEFSTFVNSEGRFSVTNLGSSNSAWHQAKVWIL